ncbi:proteinase inhibitor I4, serpin [Paenibacillus mucilaginosus 3016]|uniref:Proteinase inhibitor I4, serpin n=1 Tax=Paenibacillus mucilaginosus 3016 TaxID=1116391 RepID=H6NBF1_9BACL|nr:serpin family protein [Paenibacillus mucilaginosus]AFC32897.1 proteinase inhibitor I4, serpin [Paenibacillus mucilaginosus 3016]WFA21348.1 serpin family protein [Paenibacillus mucilaginosus]
MRFVNKKTYTYPRGLLVLMSAALLLAGCGSGQERRAEAAVEKRTYELKELDPRIVTAHNRFGLELHRRLAAERPGENLFLSPYSVASALSLIYHGAEGATLSEMSRVLQTQGMPMEEWNRGSRILRDLLQHSGEAVHLNAANSVWTRKGISLRESFLNRSREDYGAEVRELDFSHRKAAKTMNNWVKNSTGGRIQAVVEDPIPGSTLMYLINAVYFKGRWADPFEKSATGTKEFYPTADGPAVSVQMMRGQGQYPYLQEMGYQAVRLSYEGGPFHMLLVLPDEGLSLAQVQEKLGADTEFWRRDMPRRQGTVELPRFKLEGDYTLNEALKGLGMETAFDPEKAEFTGISGSEKVLYLSGARHKTYIRVDEEGTEAAAVTALNMAGSAPPEDGPFHMTVNRPFLLAIQSSETGSLLFLGSIYKPEE